MKRSNKLSILLFSALYFSFYIILGVFLILPAMNTLTGFKDEFRIIQIENPALTSECIRIDTTHASEFSDRQLSNMKDRSYLYYSNGKQRHIPTMWSFHTDTLRIGSPSKVKSSKMDNMVLNIRINSVQTIELNGKKIWNR